MHHRGSAAPVSAATRSVVIGSSYNSVLPTRYRERGHPMNQPAPAVAPATDNPDQSLQAMLSVTGCTLERDSHGPQACPPAADTGQTDISDSSAPCLSAVPAIGVIDVSGPEAAGFLQGQLTNDTEKLADNTCQWSGLCTPKGRLLATFLVCRSGDSFRLLIHRDLASAISRRLSMYVLRARVKVVDQSARVLALGLRGVDPGGLTISPTLPNPAPMTRSGESPVVIGLPAVQVAGQSVQRAVVLCDDMSLQATWSALSDALPVRHSSWWRATEVLSGIAQVSPLIQEAFVPQMVNFELIGGVSFDKGCYTGQEVVARSQYLGKMKRRMFLASVSSEPVPGDEVTDANGQQAGTVVASAPGMSAGIDAQSVVLFEARVDHDGPLQISGAMADPLSLPYDIPEPTPFVRPV